MAQGTIKSLRDRQGFGFIAPDGGGPDLFFHQTAVEGDGFRSLREGQRVAYEAGPDPRDPRRNRATRVHPVAGEPSPTDKPLR